MADEISLLRAARERKRRFDAIFGADQTLSLSQSALTGLPVEPAPSNSTPKASQDRVVNANSTAAATAVLMLVGDPIISVSVAKSKPQAHEAAGSHAAPEAEEEEEDTPVNEMLPTCIQLMGLLVDEASKQTEDAAEEAAGEGESKGDQAGDDSSSEVDDEAVAIQELAEVANAVAASHASATATRSLTGDTKRSPFPSARRSRVQDARYRQFVTAVNKERPIVRQLRALVRSFMNVPASKRSAPQLRPKFVALTEAALACVGDIAAARGCTSDERHAWVNRLLLRRVSSYCWACLENSLRHKDAAIHALLTTGNNHTFKLYGIPTSMVSAEVAPLWAVAERELQRVHECQVAMDKLVCMSNCIEALRLAVTLGLPSMAEEVEGSDSEVSSTAVEPSAGKESDEVTEDAPEPVQEVPAAAPAGDGSNPAKSEEQSEVAAPTAAAASEGVESGDDEPAAEVATAAEEAEATNSEVVDEGGEDKPAAASEAAAVEDFADFDIAAAVDAAMASTNDSDEEAGSYPTADPVKAVAEAADATSDEADQAGEAEVEAEVEAGPVEEGKGADGEVVAETTAEEEGGEEGLSPALRAEVERVQQQRANIMLHLRRMLALLLAHVQPRSLATTFSYVRNFVITPAKSQAHEALSLLSQALEVVEDLQVSTSAQTDPLGEPQFDAAEGCPPQVGSIPPCFKPVSRGRFPLTMEELEAGEIDVRPAERVAHVDPAALCPPLAEPTVEQLEEWKRQRFVFRGKDISQLRIADIQRLVQEHHNLKTTLSRLA